MSISSNYMFNDFGCNPTSMLGFGTGFGMNNNFPTGIWAANSLFSIASMIASNVGSKSGSTGSSNDSAPARTSETVAEEIESYKQKNEDIIDNEIFDENGVTLDNIKSFDIASSNAQKDVTDAQQAVNDNENTINAFTEDDEYILSKYQNVTEAKDDNKEIEFETAQKHKISADRAKAKKSSLENDLKNAKQKLEALKKAIEDAKGKIDDNNEKIKELQNEQEKLKNQEDTKTLDKADGTKWGLFGNGRTSKTKLDAKINDSIDNGYDKVSSRDLHAALKAYQDAANDKEKTSYKNAFIKMYESYASDGNNNKSLKAAYDLLKNK